MTATARPGGVPTGAGGVREKRRQTRFFQTAYGPKENRVRPRFSLNW